MGEQSDFVGDGSTAVVAPCNTCAFAYPRRKRTSEVYRMGSRRPDCAWHIDSVPMDILKRKKVCSRYVEKPAKKS